MNGWGVVGVYGCSSSCRLRQYDDCNHKKLSINFEQQCGAPQPDFCLFCERWKSFLLCSSDDDADDDCKLCNKESWRTAHSKELRLLIA